MPKVEITEQEKQIIILLRGLIPYEEVKIVKDKDGRPDCYFITRTQKIVINKEKFVDNE